MNISDDIILKMNKKRVKTKDDWIDILKNEEQDNNIVLETLFYMMGCVNRISNGLNIQKALKLNHVPNAEFVNFGKRIIKLKNIPEQEGSESLHRYWNIPFETVPLLNKKIFTWKIRDELADALIEYYNLSYQKIETIEEAFEECLDLITPEEYNKRIYNDLVVREEFVKRFNISYLMKLELEDFVTGRSTIDERGKNAFCYLLESKMMQLGDMRGATSEKFGVYYSRENKYEFAKKYGNNLEEAFLKVKQEICNLIIAGNNEDYDTISKSFLPPLFKGKILSTYYPEKYLCIFKEEHIDKFLYLLGIDYSTKEINTLEKKKVLLKEYKNNHKEFSKYSDYYFVLFLYNYFKLEIKENNTVNGQIDSNIELVEFNYIGRHIKEKSITYRSRETDYEKINRNKKDVGNRGEDAVLKYEKQRLLNLGLAELSEQVCKTENDALGYDIVSYNEKGEEIYIEVKTNSGNSSKIIDFYLTDNEYKKLESEPNYYIYYLYSIKNKPKMHIIDKEFLILNRESILEPVLYKIDIDVEKINKKLK